MSHIDDLILKLGGIRLRLALLRNVAMEGSEGFNALAESAKFDALHAEVINLIRGSTDFKVRALGSRFLVLGRWEPFEPREKFSIFVSSTSATVPQADRQHQIGEMCAKLDFEINAFIREDLTELGSGTQRAANHRPKGTGMQDADQPHVRKMHELILERKISPSRAAQEVAKDAPGVGTLESKVTRLVKRYKDIYGA
jgi:hypothetical protein